MKVGFLNFDRDRSSQSGSARIRTTNVIKYRPDFEVFVTGQKYDAVVFQKYYWHDYAELYQGIKILDICDPDWLSGASVVDIQRFLNSMDGVVANTEPMKQYMQKLTDKPVIVIPDRHDMSTFKEQKFHKGKAKSVLWFGYSHNAHVLKPFIPKLMELGLKLTIMSDKFVSVTSYQYTEYKDSETCIDFPTGPDMANQMNIEFIKHDIALLPTRHNPQEQYKSNNKDTHAWAVGLPVAKWAEDLELFMDPKARMDEKDKMMDATRKEYDCKLSGLEYAAFIKDISLKSGKPL